MAKSSVVSLDFEASTANYRKELEATGKYTKKQVNKMTGEWVRAQRKIEREHKATAKVVAQQAAKMARAHEMANDRMKGSAERTASLLGGRFADISDVVFDLGERVGVAATNIGGMQGAAVAAAGGLTMAGLAAGFIGMEMWELVSSSREVMDNLEEMGHSTGLDEEATERLKEFNQTADAMGIVSKRASLAISADLAPSLTHLANILLAVEEKTGGVSVSLGDPIGLFGMLETAVGKATGTGDKFAETMEVIRGKVNDPTGLFQWLSSEGAAVADTLDEITQNMKEFADIEIMGPDFDAMMAEESKAAQKAFDDRHKAAEKAAKEKEKRDAAAMAALNRQIDAEMAYAAQVEKTRQAFEAYEAAGASAFVQMQTEAAKQTRLLTEANREAEEQIVAVGAKLESTWDAAALAVQQQLIIDQTLRVGDVMGDVLSVAGGLFEESIARQQQEAERQEEYATKTASRAAARARAKVEGEKENGKISEEVAKGKLKAIDAEEKQAIRAARRESKERQKIAMKAFRAQKIIARTQATMSSAAGVVKAFAQNPLPSPLGPIAAGVITGALATNLSKINRQKPPQFPMGFTGSPDGDHRVPAYIQDDEVVVNRRGVRDAGGVAAIESLNRGEGLGGTTTIIENLTVQLDPRETRRFLQGEKVTTRLGRRDPHKGGR